MDQKVKALEFFEDWTNYLLVTTVAALKMFWFWGPGLTARLRCFCFPQHVLFLAAVLIYACATASR